MTMTDVESILSDSRGTGRARRVAVGLFPALILTSFFLFGQPAELLRRPENFERSRDYDPIHYKLTIVLDDRERSYRGENTITFAALKDDLGSVAFDAEDFAVTAVTDAQGASLPYSLAGKKLVVSLPGRLGYGMKTSVTVRFWQKEPKTGLKFIAAAPDHPAQVNTYSWPEDAHHWFPCYDYPNGKATSEITATARSDWKVLSNGRLAEITEDKSTGTRTWHWTQEKPHPAYCIMLAAGPFEVVSAKLGQLPVDFWVYPKDVADAPRSFSKTPKMIEFYERTFGFPYPWDKYDQVCVAGSGGGMEATTATILGQATIHNERADEDFSSDGLVAHELAHMWWGDLITERAWSDVWLSESFATYSEYLFARFDRGEDEGALNMEEKKDEYFREAHARYIRPIVFDRYNVPWEIMDAHSYPKGAAVLHMLRFVMGDKAFFRALREFLVRFAFKNADTHDFMTVIKDTSGQNLDWFFDQWVFKPGHPIFEVVSQWDGDHGKLRLKVRQKQDSSSGVPVFRTPVRIGLRTASRASSREVWVEHAQEDFEFDVPEKPLLIHFDEGNFLLKELVFDQPLEERVFALCNDDVVGRLRAATELANSAAEPVVREALRAAARMDASWAVRRTALESAAGGGGPGLEAFLTGMTRDGNSKVRAAAIRALGRTGEARLAPFFESVFKQDRSYVVQAAALTATGECGGRDRIPFLKKAATLPSPMNILRKAAESAIRKVEAATAPGPSQSKGLDSRPRVGSAFIATLGSCRTSTSLTD